MNGRWAQVVTWEEVTGTVHSQGIQGTHREMVDLRGTRNTNEGMVSESLCFSVFNSFSSRLWLESFGGGPVPTLQGEARQLLLATGLKFPGSL